MWLLRTIPAGLALSALWASTHAFSPYDSAILPSGLLLIAGVGLAAVFSSEIHPSVVIGGAIGALVFAWTAHFSVPLGGALFAAAVHMPRARRAERLDRALWIVASAFIGGGLGTYLVGAHGENAFDAFAPISALAIGSLAIVFPTLISVADKSSHRLRSLAAARRGVARIKLLRALLLWRRFETIRPRLRRSTAKQLIAIHERSIAFGKSEPTGTSESSLRLRAFDTHLEELETLHRAAERAIALERDPNDALAHELAERAREVPLTSPFR